MSSTRQASFAEAGKVRRHITSIKIAASFCEAEASPRIHIDFSLSILDGLSQTGTLPPARLGP